LDGAAAHAAAIAISQLNAYIQDCVVWYASVLQVSSAAAAILLLRCGGDAWCMRLSCKHQALLQAISHLPYTGMAISSSPKNTFWKPPLDPGCTMHATDGVGRPASSNISTTSAEAAAMVTLQCLRCQS
jgi:hypothetical protein